MHSARWKRLNNDTFWATSRKPGKTLVDRKNLVVEKKKKFPNSGNSCKVMTYWVFSMVTSDWMSEHFVFFSLQKTFRETGGNEKSAWIQNCRMPLTLQNSLRFCPQPVLYTIGKVQKFALPFQFCLHCFWQDLDTEGKWTLRTQESSAKVTSSQKSEFCSSSCWTLWNCRVTLARENWFKNKIGKSSSLIKRIYKKESNNTIIAY